MANEVDETKIDEAIGWFFDSLFEAFDLRWAEIRRHKEEGNRTWEVVTVDKNLMALSRSAKTPTAAYRQIVTELSQGKMVKLTKAPDWLSEEDKKKFEKRR